MGAWGGRANAWCVLVAVLALCLGPAAPGAAAVDEAAGGRRLSAVSGSGAGAGAGATAPSLLSNPFLSDACRDSFADNVFALDKPATKVGVVIPVRNEAKAVLLHTVKSLLKNSAEGGGLLKTVVVVDDMSETAVKSWSEWRTDKVLSAASSKGMLQVVEPKTRAGVAGAKDFGARLIQSSVDVVAFVDAHVVVSDNWLQPLVHVLEGYPRSVVYPAIDIIDPESGSFAKADNVVGGFTWALGFRWEALTSGGNRLPLASSGKGEDDVVTSPAAPGILAVRSDYYVELGGFDVALQPWGQENIELSIRTWLCGGLVIRQPCSRVAHRYDNLFRKTTASAGNGVSQASVDLNVMSVAEHWMKPAYRELVHAARFTGRIPYTVQLDLDVKQPYLFNKNANKPLGESGCATFDWFLKEIYPGLLADVPGVEERFRAHIEGDYLHRGLEPWIKMYQTGLASTKPRIADAHTEELLKQRAGSAAQLEVQRQHDSLIPKPAYNPSRPGVRQTGLGKRREDIHFDLSDEKDPHERHANFVRETLQCQDESNVPHSAPCEKMAATTNGCKDNRYYMMFGCPKACGLCGTDGKICFDFYEHKCPEYKKEGRCELEDEAEQLKHDCRLSCGHCTPATPPPQQQQQQQQLQPPPLVAQPPIVPPAAPVVGAAAVIPAPPVIPGGDQPAYPLTVPGLNHRLAQEQYAQGLLPDVLGSNPCQLNGLPHGSLLARVPVAPPAPAPAPAVRIFCALYTMEKNHATNVKAVKETWGKRCDGFVAFSTVSDASLPAWKIEHEGDEAYDNMWQKSRSIWKLVAKSFASQFDFFLIGGDDMYYVIENLRAYLGSQEIRDLQAKGKGLFLGRRFFPPKQHVFNSGGAGYTLDRIALNLLAANIDSPHCFPHQRGFWEDVNVANCLRESGGIVPYDTRDKLERERFHPFTPGQHLDYRKPAGEGDWYPKYNPYLKEGFECCSSESISFHYVPAELLYRLHAYQHHCDAKLAT